MPKAFLQLIGRCWPTLHSFLENSQGFEVPREGATGLGVLGDFCIVDMGSELESNLICINLLDTTHPMLVTT